MKKTLLVGYGNPLRGDDAVGWVVASLLSSSEGEEALRVRTLHQLLPELAWELAEFDTAVFVDASAEERPGSVRIREVQPPREAPVRLFSHHVGPRELLSMAQALFGHAPRAFLVTIGGKEFGFSEQLSPEVQAAATKAAEYVRALLKLDRKGLLDVGSARRS
jgi:hydrogenase maturation protease